ncbi:MAG: CotS family spore coat protein [Bacillota bacterium]
MLGTLKNKCTSEIDSKEEALLERILSKYSFNVFMVEKVRSAYKLYTNKGMFCLKRISHGYSRAKKAYIVSKHLRDNGFDKLAEYYLTKNKCLFVRYKKSTFYVTKWLKGREASFNSIEDILVCSRLLAEFHSKSRGFETAEKTKIEKHYSNWRSILKRQWSQLSRLYKNKKKTAYDNFDKMYFECFDTHKKLYKMSLRLLDSKSFDVVAKEGERTKYLCHDSFYYQNVILVQNRPYIIDMESCTMDMPVADLGKFIRRIMSRSRYLWDFDLCRKIIYAYCQERELTYDELKVLLAIIVYPHKYWKLGRKRFIKKKEWTEEKFMRRLKKIIKQYEYINEFIYCYKNFYNIL